MSYYKNNSFECKGLLTKEYFKKVKTRNGVQLIYLDAAAYSDKNLMKENKNIEIPWSLLEKNCREIRFNGIKARIPLIELLIIYKVKAFRDRNFELKKMQVQASTAVAEMDFLKSKINKDKNDIKELFKLKINKSKLKNLLKSTGFIKLFEETINEIRLARE